MLFIMAVSVLSQFFARRRKKPGVCLALKAVHLSIVSIHTTRAESKRRIVDTFSKFLLYFFVDQEIFS